MVALNQFQKIFYNSLCTSIILFFTYPSVGLIFREIVESAESRFSNLIVRSMDGEFEEQFSQQETSICNGRLESIF